MEVEYKGLADQEIELFVEAWDIAEFMLFAVLRNNFFLLNESDAYKKWFKTAEHTDQIEDNFEQIYSFFTKNGQLIIKKSSLNVGENVHGSSQIIKENEEFLIELPPKFFDARGFLRRPDVLIHEISHLVANTNDMELEPRGGNRMDELQFDVTTQQLMSQPVQRTDQYYRYHASKLPASQAACCAASYEFFIKDMYLEIDNEYKKQLEEEFFKPPANPAAAPNPNGF